MKIYMKIVDKQYHRDARLHVFGCRIVQVDGNNITEGPISYHGNHRKNIDEQFGGSWRRWLTEVVKAELMDHWHAANHEGHLQEIADLMEEEL